MFTDCLIEMSKLFILCGDSRIVYTRHRRNPRLCIQVCNSKFHPLALFIINTFNIREKKFLAAEASHTPHTYIIMYINLKLIW